MSGTASVVAKRGVGKLLSATRSGLSVISESVTKARKTYANKHENSVLAELRNKNLSLSDYVFEALLKVYFLYLAGYKHEVVACALQAGKRLTDGEKSSVPLDIVFIFGNSLCNESLKHGDLEKGKFQQSMQDFLNKARMGKEHFDRDSLVHDIYYAVLIAAETTGTEWQTLYEPFKEAASRVIENSVHVTTDTANARLKAAKALYLFAMQIMSCAQDADQKRQKALKEAEELIRKEQERLNNLRLAQSNQPQPS